MSFHTVPTAFHVPAAARAADPAGAACAATRADFNLQRDALPSRCAIAAFAEVAR